MNENIQEALIQWRAAGCPRKTRQERFDDKPTRKLAIELFCISCMGGESEPKHKAEIRACTSKGCPLRVYRPFNTGGDK